MRFKEFLEISGTVDFPAVVAAKWRQALPKRSSKINRAEAKAFAFAMGNRSLNEAALLDHMLGAATPGSAKVVYEKPIVGNLILAQAGDPNFPKLDLLKNAVGELFIPGAPGTQIILAFIPVHPKNAAAVAQGAPDVQGSIMISLAPLIYQPQDRLALYGVILHETRHAYDFASGIDSGDDMPMTANEYLQHLMEMRSHSEQIVELLEVMVSMGLTPEKAVSGVRQMLKTGPFALHQESQRVADKYLDGLLKRPELFTNRPPEETPGPPIQLPGPKQEAPGPKQEMWEPQPPAIVRPAENIKAQMLAQRAAKLLSEWLKAHEAGTFFAHLQRKYGINLNPE